MFQSSPFSVVSRTIALLGAIGLAVAIPRLSADPLTHGEDDTFAADAAKLLPAAPPTLAAVPTPAQRITLGDWTAPIAWTPHIPVSAATLPDGRVLTFASNQRTTFPSGPEFTYAATWNPATGVFTEYNNSFHDMFCGGLVMLPDGRVLVNGGRNTTVLSSIFDWRSNAWYKLPNMNDPRWYNTTVALPSGRVWTASGSGGSTTAERWDASSGWSRLPGIDWGVVTAEPGYINIWHPFLLLARDGRLFHFGPTRTMHWVTPDGSGSLVNAGPVVPGTHYPKEGAWVMYDEGKILVAGGGTNTTANASDTTTGTSSTTAYTVDLNGASPVVTPASSLRFGRQFANVVVLPTGEVMVMGGNTSGLKFNDTGSILTPEIWNPTNGQWRLAADMSVPRNYHSLSLLLPDGRVLSGGSGLGGNSADHQDVQLFTPPTLFKADGTLATRPVLSSAPSVIGVATKFNVSGTAGLKKFALIRMAAITHSVNTDLRYLSLPFVETTAGNYQLTARNNLNVMTPGYWMLFGLDTAGVYSVAKIVQVDPTSGVLVVAQGNQSSTVGQGVSLQLSATGPAGAVLTWSATGLPAGLAINTATGKITGTPTTAASSSVTVSVTDGNTSDSKSFTWVVQPSSVNQNFVTFAGASGLTLNGNASISGAVLRLTTNIATRVGSAFLSSPIPVGPNTSFTTRFVFRMSGTADGADGMAFFIQGNSATALGTAGGGLGYGGVGKSLAIELDTYQGAGDPNTNHIGIITNGVATAHVATWNATWDLENGASHTAWVEYDGTSNQLRVYAAQGIVTQRPGSPVITATIDLPAFVGTQAWFGFSGATGGASNNHDVESWSLSVNAFALPVQPVLTAPGDQLNVVGTTLTRQLVATDGNGDLLTWSATGLPTGLSISPSSGLVSGTPTATGAFTSTVTVTDGNTTPVSTTFKWTINPVLTVQPLTGTTIAAGTSVALTVQSAGGLNPKYQWSFGDGTPDSASSATPSVNHTFANPGRYLVVVTVRDDTGRQLTASYRQAVSAPLVAAKSSASSSIRYETRATGNARLWVVNPDNDSVTVIDAVTRAKLTEIPVGQAPRTLAIAGDGRVWVVNAGSASITVLKPDYTLAQTIALPRGSRPFGIVFSPAGTNAFVALEFGGKVLKLDSATGTVLGSANVGLNVRHLSIHGDGTKLLATRFVTPPVPGENTASPQTTIGTTNYGGEVVVLDPATLATLSTVVLAHSEQPDTSNSAHGIPNYLGAAAISPDGQVAWVPSKQDNIKRGTLRSGGSLTHDMSMRSIASRIVIGSMSEDLAGRVDYDNAGVASAAAFDPSGVFLYTALEGDREIAVTDSWGKREVLRFDVGRAPQGVVVSPDGKTLYVQNFMDRTVTFHDLTSLVNGLEVAPPAPTTVACVTTEKLTPTVLNGKQLFYDTRDTRIAFQQYISCASCHSDGGQDGRIWDFTQFGEGLRNTITLRGHGGTAQGPLHWTGNFDEVQDFEGQIRAFAAGTGLMTDVAFHTGTRSDPLGDPKTGASADLDALAAYVSSLTAQGDSPDRNADGTMTPEALAGQLVFSQKNCVACHSGSQFTDSALGLFHNIGTIKSSSGQRLGAALTGLDTPTLRGLWNTAPYLHDGSASTLDQAISAHSGVTLTPTELSGLVAFLRQLDEAGATPTITGLKGQYFNGRSFDVLALERVDAKVDFDWGTGAPGTGVGIDGFTVRWTGRVQPLYSETYTFSAITDDGFRLWINNQLIIDSWIDQAPTEHAGVPIALVAGTRYDIKIEYYENGGGAVSRLFWTSPSQVKEIVPTARLTPTVAQLPLVTWANPGAVTYGTALGAAQLNATANVPGSFSYSPASGTILNAGLAQTLSVTFTPADQSAYSVVSKTVQLDVAKALLTITASDRSKLYGAAVPALGVSYSAFVNGESAAVLDTPAVVSTVATAASPVSNYPITVTGATDANYAITFVNGTLAVTRAPLTIRADDKSRAKGLANPALTASYTGFVNGENPSVLSPAVSLTTTATPASAVGTYPITPSAAASPNYLISFVNGTFTVTPPLLTSLAVTPTTASVNVGGVQAFSAVGTYTDGSTADLTATAVWSSSNTGVATVSAVGTATGVASGTSQITATSGAFSDSGTLTVNSGVTQRTFSNAALINLPDVGPASTYPSTINVSGLSAGLSAIKVTLNQLNHTYPGDLDILLVGPAGQKVILMSDAGGGADLVNVDLTFDPTATASLSDVAPITSGVYKPTNFDTLDTFTAPAPAGPYNGSLSDFLGSNPNGNWSLFIVDDASADLGTLAGGWSLTLTTGGNQVPTLSAITDRVINQGTSTPAIPFVVGDAETPAGSLVVTAVSTSPILTPASGIVLGGSGANRTLTITPDPVLTGSATITVTVTDGNSAVATTSFLLTVVDPSASTTTWANAASITLPDLGPAATYPSSINVSGVSGALSRIQVKLNQLSHTYPDDLDILLVGPAGQKVLLVSDVGGSGDLINVDLTLDSASVVALPDNGQVVSRTYKATNFETGDAFASPAPAGPYSEVLSDFVGSNPNGTWSLYILDDASSDAGTLAGGWNLVLTTGGNQSPTITSLSNVSLNKNSSSAAIPFTVADAETPAASLVVTATSSNPTLIAPSGLVLGGSGANRTLTITPVANQTGSATITVSVADATGGVGKTTFSVTVSDPNGITFATFNNLAPITIADLGPASAYPSTIAVAGVSSPIAAIQVKLNQLSHTYADDVDILLVSPAGQKIMLMSDVGGNSALASVDLVLDTSAASTLPDTSGISSGSYLPSDFEPGDALPAPAPAGPYSVALTDVVGTSANGTWALYISDDAGQDAGTLAGGWSLVIGTSAPTLAGLAAPAPTPFTRIASVKRDLLGRTDITIEGVPGSWYRLESSSDLNHWTPVTSLLSSDGVLHYLDEKATGQTVRFYRAVQTNTPFESSSAQ